MIRFLCPSCKAVLSVADDTADKTVKCRDCGKLLVVPRVGTPAAPSAREKTTLGQVIGHKPAVPPKATPAPRRPRRAAEQGPAAPRSSARVVVVAGLVLFVFAAAGLFGYGVYRFFDSEKERDAPVAQGQPPVATQSSPPGVHEIDDVVIEDLPPQRTADGERPLLPDPKPAFQPDPKPVDPKPVDAKPVDTPAPVAKDPDPKPEKKSADDDPELAPILKRLKGGTQEERVAAAEELGKKGKAARAASRALCEAALDTAPKVGRAALDALERVNPALQKEVFILLVDNAAPNHVAALARLQEMGEDARPALPVIVFRIKRCQEQFAEQLLGRPQNAALPWTNVTLSQVVQLNMETLPKIAPDDPTVVKTLLEETKFQTPTAQFPGGIRIPGQLGATYPFRAKAVELLGNVAEDRKESRKEIVPALTTAVTDAAKQLDSVQAFQLPAAIAELDGAGNALLKCGPDAKASLTKQVLPQLKKLKFHANAQVRDEAEKLSKKIEDPD